MQTTTLSGTRFVVGSGSNDFRLALVPAAKIAGRITDKDGEPVEQAQIQLLSFRIVRGGKVWLTEIDVETDEDGSYHFNGLEPRRYLIFASGPGRPPESWDAPGRSRSAGLLSRCARLGFCKPSRRVLVRNSAPTSICKENAVIA